MRLIDADKLRKDVLDLPNCYNGFSDTYDKAMIVDLVDEQPTVDAEPTEEQVKEYCRKRCLVVVTSDMDAPTIEAEPTWHGHWEWNDYGGFGNYHCTVCRYIPYEKFSRKFHPDYMYCPRCGAKMDGGNT